MLNQLWRLDTNRLKPETDYIISPQVSIILPFPLLRSAKHANPMQSVFLTLMSVCVFMCFAQGRAGYVAHGSNYARDRARAPLFTYVNEDKLKGIETYLREKHLISPLGCTYLAPTTKRVPLCYL